MSCEGNVCGTGGWSGPLPGDPSNDIFIAATAAFGGIDVTWSYPTTNAFAIAYATVYRGLSSNFEGALPIAQDTDGFYFDPVAPGKEYFYWIQVVSINGTIGDVIGPASAMAKSSIEETIRQLTGKIDSGVLAQALKTEIARIPAIDDKLFQEIQDRLAANVALSTVLAQLHAVTDETLAYVHTETTQRQDADGALVNSINILFAQSDGHAAAINEERTVRVSKDEALATRIDSLAAVWENDIEAAIVTEREARVSADEALASDITTLYTRHGENAAAIINEQETRSNALEAVAIDITELYARYDSVGGDTSEAIEAAIQAERTVRVSAEEAIASDVTTLFTRMGTADAAILNEQTVRSEGDSAVANMVTTLRTDMDDAIVAAVSMEADARTDADSALASLITNVESAWNTNLAQVETSMSTNIQTVDGKVTSIGALWTAKVSVNGLIGGFGIYNDGTEVEAGFDVDTFWIGRTNADKKKPFIVSGGQVFIDDAVIHTVVIDKLRTANGGVVIEGGKIKAELIDVDNIIAKKIDVQSAASGPRITMVNTGIHVYGGTNYLAVKIGSLM